MKKEMLYEGKAKIVYQTGVQNKVILYFKDDATAFNGLKKKTIENKGKLNNKISVYIFKELEKRGVVTQFIECVSENEQLCVETKVVPLEFICRNQVYGSMSKRLGIKQGYILEEPLFEICYKNDELNDPLINDAHAYALGIVSKEELAKFYQILFDVNKYLIEIFNELDITLIDFKIELGYDSEGNILLSDEISPDSCRLLDKVSGKQLDKDLFRHDLGDITNAYQEIVNRIEKKCSQA